MRSALLISLLAFAACGHEAPRVAEGAEQATGTAKAAPPSASAALVPADTRKPNPSTAISSTDPPRFQALGTEPFWSVTVLPGKLRYATPDKPDGTDFAATYALAGAVHRFTGTLQGKPAVLNIGPGTCSDGMSDTVYAFTASFAWDGRTERGCARRD